VKSSELHRQGCKQALIRAHSPSKGVADKAASLASPYLFIDAVTLRNALSPRTVILYFVNDVKETSMSFAELLGAFVLGAFVGGVGGTVLGFVWYEHKSGLLSDSSGKRAAAIRFELDDVFERKAATGGDERFTLGRHRVASSTPVKAS
jgi:hypothetical protein